MSKGGGQSLSGFAGRMMPGGPQMNPQAMDQMVQQEQQRIMGHAGAMGSARPGLMGMFGDQQSAPAGAQPAAPAWTPPPPPESRGGYQGLIGGMGGRPFDPRMLQATDMGGQVRPGGMGGIGNMVGGLMGQGQPQQGTTPFGPYGPRLANGGPPAGNGGFNPMQYFANGVRKFNGGV